MKVGQHSNGDGSGVGARRLFPTGGVMGWSFCLAVSSLASVASAVTVLPATAQSDMAPATKVTVIRTAVLSAIDHFVGMGVLAATDSATIFVLPQPGGRTNPHLGEVQRGLPARYKVLEGDPSKDCVSAPGNERGCILSATGRSITIGMIRSEPSRATITVDVRWSAAGRDGQPEGRHVSLLREFQIDETGRAIGESRGWAIGTDGTKPRGTRPRQAPTSGVPGQ